MRKSRAALWIVDASPGTLFIFTVSCRNFHLDLHWAIFWTEFDCCLRITFLPVHSHFAITVSKDLNNSSPTGRMIYILIS